MSELYDYIAKEVLQLVQRAKKRPPKRVSSLVNLRRLVAQSALPPAQMRTIAHSFDALESAMKSRTTHSASLAKPKSAMTNYVHSAPLRKTALSTHQNGKMQRVEGQKLIESMLVDESGHAPTQQPQCFKEVEKLQNKLEKLKQYRNSREVYLEELIVRAQRLERIKESRYRYQASKQYLVPKLGKKTIQKKISESKGYSLKKLIKSYQFKEMHPQSKIITNRKR